MDLGQVQVKLYLGQRESKVRDHNKLACLVRFQVPILNCINGSFIEAPGAYIEGNDLGNYSNKAWFPENFMAKMDSQLSISKLSSTFGKKYLLLTSKTFIDKLL